MVSALIFAFVAAHAGPMDKVPGNTGDTDKNAQIEQKACKDGADLVLDGRGSVWNVTGKCGKVTVKGQGNAVTIEALAMLVGAGQGHAITYTGNLSGKPALPTNLKECTGCAVKQAK